VTLVEPIAKTTVVTSLGPDSETSGGFLDLNYSLVSTKGIY
jgi:hypothetical protein